MAAWPKEKKMEKREATDLCIESEVRNIVIVQPNYGETKDLRFFDRLDRETILNEAKKFHYLHHLGTMSLTFNGEEPQSYVSCGGILSIKQTIDDSKSWMKCLQRRPSLMLTCSNKRCNMELWTYLPADQLWNFLFHLMIKQMIPDMKTCYYLDCRQMVHNQESRSGLDLVSRLGTISLTENILFGHIDNGEFSPVMEFEPDKFAIGFTIQPGVETLNGCDELDEWLKFLFLKKIEQITEVHEKTNLFLRGPKTKYR
ncbi:MAG: hypothetical protein NT116_00085 [Candidatus Parcubacteria bacterium]|nr:hypothetical protein [Candidatus Parcubacteria bacterium]